MDKFKQHLQNQNWEVDEPSPKAWQDIQQKMQANMPLQIAPKAKKGIVVFMFKYAVAACVIGLAAVGGWYIINKPAEQVVVKVEVPVENKNTQPSIPKVENKQEQIIVPQNQNRDVVKQVVTKLQKTIAPTATTSTPNNTPNYSSQLQQMENNFTQVIYLQKAKINQTPLFGESAEHYRDFTDKLNQMDKDEKLIKKDIVQIGLTPELMEQLINVYQQKLNVLKLLQNEIQKTNNKFKQNRTAADTLKTHFIEI